MSSKDVLYQAKNLSFRYRLDQQMVQALKNVDLDIKKGELLLIMGPSGSGKSTLLNLLGLIEPVQEGEILFQGKDLRTQDEKQLNALRRYKIGFVFQSFLLFDVLTAAENVEYFLVRQGLDKATRKQRVEDALKKVDLLPQAKQRPQQMSGGQRQRVAIARALAKAPEVIIADEPTASLDQHTSREILKILRSLADAGTTVIMASHDSLVKDYATRQIYIADGSIKQGDSHVV